MSNLYGYEESLTLMKRLLWRAHEQGSILFNGREDSNNLQLIAITQPTSPSKQQMNVVLARRNHFLANRLLAVDKCLLAVISVSGHSHVYPGLSLPQQYPPE